MVLRVNSGHRARVTFFRLSRPRRLVSRRAERRARHQNNRTKRQPVFYSGRFHICFLVLKSKAGLARLTSEYFATRNQMAGQEQNEQTWFHNTANLRSCCTPSIAGHLYLLRMKMFFSMTRLLAGSCRKVRADAVGHHGL